MKPALALALMLAGCGVSTELRDLDGAHGTNRPGHVTLDPDAPERAAVWAQEAWEAEWKLDPANALRVRIDPQRRRWMEIASHEVEVQAAVVVYGRDEAPRRAQEAAAMQRGYDGLFRAYTVADIAAAMEGRRIAAASWVSRHLDDIREWRE